MPGVIGTKSSHKNSIITNMVSYSRENAGE
jgi:hypothetical protein